MPHGEDAYIGRCMEECACFGWRSRLRGRRVPKMETLRRFNSAFFIGVSLLIVSEVDAQPINVPYTVHGDTVQVRRLESSELNRGARIISDSLAKVLTSGNWCVTTNQDTLRCRCIFNAASGKVQGAVVEYDVSGRPVTFRHYTNGRENGIAVHWNTDGQLISLTSYKNGELDGIRIAFNDREKVAGVEYWYKGSPIQSQRYTRCKRNKLLSALFSVAQLAPDNKLRLLNF